MLQALIEKFRNVSKIFAAKTVDNLKIVWGCPRDVMVKVMDCEIVRSEFELHSRYYVHFRTNTPGKGMNPLTLPAMG